MKEDRNKAQLFRDLLSGGAPEIKDEAARALALAASDTDWRRNQPCDNAIAGSRVACVVAGAVRKYSIRTNGQRQIVDLLMPGDFLGLSPFDPSFSLEAVRNGTRIASFRAERLKALEEHYPVIAMLVRDRASDAIRRLEQHLLVQGCTSATEKVGGYLVAMCGRMAGHGGRALELPVSRYDIADHLGLAVETVSRTMTVLTRCGMIALPSPRHVEIRNPAMLADGGFF
jgi:CRP-like cAMP-binding protein